MITAPLPQFIERVRVGGYSHRNDYTTIFHDCLPGKEWLELHYKDEYPEPTIDVIVDGKSTHFNGTYKKGVVKDLMALYTTKVRIGRRSVNLDVGEADRVKG